MTSKTAVKKSEQTKETKKKVVKKEETESESESENENKSEKEEEIGTNNMTDVNIITNYSTIFIVFL